MSLSSYVIRNYCVDDFEEFVEFYRNADLEEQKEGKVAAQILKKKLRRPHYSPEHDLFLAEFNKKIVGFLDITSELRIGRIILGGFVHPHHRGRGLASRMMNLALNRGVQLKAKVVHVPISEGNIAAKSFLTKSGFIFVRCFLELKIDLSKIRGQEIRLNTAEITCLNPGKEALLRNIQNRCFFGTWGFCPNTVEEIRYYLNLINSGLEDVIVGKDDEKIFGYCWAQIIEREYRTSAQKKGRIHMFGIDPDYRRKGWGRKLLLAGLHYLRKKGVEVAELTVDRENRAGCSLYDSIGFKVSSASLWYEKNI